MKPEHMSAHPTVPGVVWDHNRQQYIPQPHPANNAQELEAFFQKNPAVRTSQASWGQTRAQQEATSHSWRLLAEAAGTKFDKPEPPPEFEAED